MTAPLPPFFIARHAVKEYVTRLRWRDRLKLHACAKTFCELPPEEWAKHGVKRVTKESKVYLLRLSPAVSVLFRHGSKSQPLRPLLVSVVIRKRATPRKVGPDAVRS